MTDPRDIAVTGAMVADDPARPAVPPSPAAAPGATPGGPGPGGPARPGLASSLARRVHLVVEGTPLRAKLVAILVVTLFAALGATGYAVQLVLNRYLVSQVDDQLRDAANRVNRDLALLRNPAGGPRGFPTQFVVQIQVSGSPGIINLFSGDELDQPPTFPQLSWEQAKDRKGRFATVRLADGSSWRITSFESADGIVITDPANRVTGPAAITVGENIDRVDSAVDWLRLVIVLIGAGVILLCTMLGGLLVRRSFRPLVEVEETAAAIAAGDLSRRIPEHPATTEVGRLTASLNGMLTQIESAFRAREASEARTRRFAADASHELRTPLVSIRGFAELFRQGAVPPDEVPRTMRRIEDEAKRMGSLVEDLLLLARLDEQRPGRKDRIDLAVLAGDAVHDARGLDPGRQVTLTGLGGTGPVPSVVVGDEDRLRQVVANLVANAVRHTPAGTPVEVAVGTAEAGPGRVAVLEVRDHGRGLSPEQAQRVFERFYRIDSSRRRDTGGGSGLGLSIVAAVVAAHAGTVGVHETPGGGATFRVTLPADGGR